MCRRLRRMCGSPARQNGRGATFGNDLASGRWKNSATGVFVFESVLRFMGNKRTLPLLMVERVFCFIMTPTKLNTLLRDNRPDNSVLESVGHSGITNANGLQMSGYRALRKTRRTQRCLEPKFLGVLGNARVVQHDRWRLSPLLAQVIHNRLTHGLIPVRAGLINHSFHAVQRIAHKQAFDRPD